MRAREFERAVVAQAPQAWSASELDQRTRRLREVGLLPVAGRGLNAPDILPEHAAAILISLTANARAERAVQAVGTYAALHPVKRAGAAPFADKATFGEALAAILGDPENRLGVAEVVVCRTWPEATVRFQHPSAERAETVYRSVMGRNETSATGEVREEVTLTYYILQELAIGLAGLNGPAALNSEQGIAEWLASGRGHGKPRGANRPRGLPTMQTKQANATSKPSRRARRQMPG